MNRIRTKEDEDAKKKKSKAIIGFVLIFLMAFSTAGFALYGITDDTTTPEIDNTERENPYFNGQYWEYNFGGQVFYFSQKFENTSVNVQVDNNLEGFLGKNIYIDSESELANNLLSLNLDRYASRMQRGCHESCEEDIPEISCEDEDAKLIVFEESDEKSVIEQENCVFIKGDLESVDAFLYTIFGVSQ